MPLPAAVQITILLTAGGTVWLRAANKDVQHTPSDHHELLIIRNRTVASGRLRYIGKDFSDENPETYFSTVALELETQKRLAEVTECLSANRRCRVYVRVLCFLIPVLIFFGIACVAAAVYLGYLAANGVTDIKLAPLFLKSLFLLIPLLVGIATLEACLFLHGREYENSRARTSVS